MLAATALLLSYCIPSSSNAAVLFSNLFSFSGTNGGLPVSGLTQGPDGALYGTTTFGPGATHGGTVFRMTPDGALDWWIPLQGTNGTWPVTAQLLLAPAGNLYGTTYKGGADGLGTVFRVATTGVLTTLISFTGTNGPFPGSIPQAGLIQAPDGYLYGTTSAGGVSDTGTVFRVDANGNFASLASFYGTNGGSPQAPLLLASDGSFYGTTERGGPDTNWGTVFRMTAADEVTSLVAFDETNGGLPIGGLALGPDGNFYGTTTSGGTSNSGTIYRLGPTGQFTNLVLFGWTNGSSPYGELTLANDGNFYGTTYEGGLYFRGTVYRLSLPGVLTTVFQFDGTNGNGPHAGVTLGSDGDFYGTTLFGLDDPSSRGSVFRLSIPLAPRLQMTLGPDGLATLTWTTAAGQTYQLQSSAGLSPPAWTNFGALISATNGTFSTPAPVVPGDARFYQVVLPP